MLLVQGKSWCRGCSSAGSPEELCSGKLPPWRMAGRLGSEGLLTRFLKSVPACCLRALLVLVEMGTVPLTGGGPKPTEMEKDPVSGECWRWWLWIWKALELGNIPLLSQTTPGISCTLTWDSDHRMQ